MKKFLLLISILFAIFACSKESNIVQIPERLLNESYQAEYKKSFFNAVDYAYKAQSKCNEALDSKKCEMLTASRICYLAGRNPEDKLAEEKIKTHPTYFKDIVKNCEYVISYIANEKDDSIETISKANTILIAQTTIEACNEGRLKYCIKTEKPDYSYIENIIKYMKVGDANYMGSKESADFKSYQRIYNIALCRNIKKYKDLTPKHEQKKEYLLDDKPYCKKYLELLGESCEFLYIQGIQNNEEACKKYKADFNARFIK